MKLPFFKKDRLSPKEFWEWFQSPEARALRVKATSRDQSSNDAAARIGYQVRRMHPDLAWGMLGGPNHEISRFEVSAGGRRELIQVVRTIVAAAPPMPGLEVVAFKQPQDMAEMVFDDIRVNRKTVMCRIVAERNGRFDMDIYLPLPADATADDLARVGFTFLDHTLGEEFVMERLGGLDFLSTLVAPPAVMPLEEFAAKRLGTDCTQ